MILPLTKCRLLHYRILFSSERHPWRMMESSIAYIWWLDDEAIPYMVILYRSRCWLPVEQQAGRLSSGRGSGSLVERRVKTLESGRGRRETRVEG